MSLINLIVREKKELYGTCVHWRQLLSLYDHKLRGIRNFMMKKMIRVKPYDAGLVIIDFDTRIIFSFQVCFSDKDISIEAQDWFLKYFTLVDYSDRGFGIMAEDLKMAGFEIDSKKFYEREGFDGYSSVIEQGKGL